MLCHLDNPVVSFWNLKPNVNTQWVEFINVLSFFSWRFLDGIHSYARRLPVPIMFADSFTHLIIKSVIFILLFGVDDHPFTYMINCAWFQCLSLDYSFLLLLHPYLYRLAGLVLYYMKHLMGYSSWTCFFFQEELGMGEISLKGWNILVLYGPKILWMFYIER